MRLSYRDTQLCTILLLVSLLLIGCAATATARLSKQFVGSSMEPNFHDGQVINIEVITPSELKRGDVIYFEIISVNLSAFDAG